MTDVEALQKKSTHWRFPPGRLVGGAVRRIEEVAGSKIQQRRRPFGHTDLTTSKPMWKAPKNR